MKIFATSYVHGNRVIMDKLNEAARLCDMLLVCGDIGNKEIYGKTIIEFSAHQRKDAEYLDGALKDLPVPARFILGNDDWFEFSGESYLDKPETAHGYEFIPFEFVLITPFNTNREVNDNKLRYELAKLNVSDKTVIVAHTPPFARGDKLYNGGRCGSRAVYDWIEHEQPRVWLCGHSHEDNSAHEIGGTKVFNCACDHTEDSLRGWLIDLDTPEYERIAI